MKFGVFDQNDRTGRPIATQYEERFKLAALYEDLGFSHYQMSEHHGTPLSVTPSPSVFLAALSQRTTRLRFGPLVYLLPIYNPMRLAEEICMLDCLSNGRFEFGVGRGASSYELGYLGVAESSAPEMYREALEVIREGLQTGRLDRKGRHWSYEDVRLSVGPIQSPPPIWYAASSPESAVWPAQNLFNLVCAGPIERVRDITARYRLEQRAVVGAGSATNLIGVNRYIFVGRTDAEATEIAGRAWRVHHANFWSLWHRYGSEPRNFKLPPRLEPVIESGFAIIGSCETVKAELRRQVSTSGVNYLSGNFAFGDLSFDEVAESARLFSEGIMPAVRETYELVRASFEAAA
jgi:alkanesulfonate monooxygenase SsuD/methylene tetrahydromethanopterin reductase-like flavin-dependent oxidoreductase (luciferase family)